MPRTLQFKRYNTASLSNIRGANGEIIIDRTKQTITIHDGVTNGGFPLPTFSDIGSSTVDQIARNTANSAVAGVTVIQGVNLTQNTNITNATNLAQAAFNQANTGGGGSKLEAKQSFDRYFGVPANTTFSDQGDGGEITIEFTPNGDLYFRTLLDRLQIHFDGGSTFYYNYENVRVRINPDTENILANVTNVIQTQSNAYTITVDEAAPGGSLVVDTINFLYDFYNTAGFDLADGSYGMVTDNDNMRFRSGRDIDLLAADDIQITGGSTFDLDLIRNDEQDPEDGIRVRTIDNGNDTTKEWRFQFDGNLTLPQGSNISETQNTTIISPPTAGLGQSLVIRPTASLWSVTSSGYIVYNTSITITVNQLNIGNYFGTVNYEITGPGVTEQSLGRPLTGNVVITTSEGGSSQPVTWTIPANSNITEFIFTLTTVDGTRSTNIETENDPALYYSFEENAMPTGYNVTVTYNGIINNESSHIHLISGDPTTTDIYLGDDDQYVKIEKNAGNVIIGTAQNTKNWIFDIDGVITLPTGGHLSATKGGTTLDGGLAHNTSLTSFYANGNYASCVTAESSGNLYITTYNDGGPNPSKSWAFDNNGILTFPDESVQTTAWAGGRVVAVPTNSTGAVGDKENDLAFSNAYMYYCTTDYVPYVPGGNIWKRIAWSGDTW